MSADQAKLGAPDPLIAGDGQQLCGHPSDVVEGMRAPFLCTRARGHADRRVAEHVASGPYESRLPIAIASWTDGSAPRLVESAR
jgi:hypothetical protein